MSGFRRRLAAHRDAAVTPEAKERVRARIRASLEDVRISKTLLGRLGERRLAAERRVRSKLAAPVRPRVAPLVLAVVGLLAVLAWGLRPGPVALDARLHAEQPRAEALTPLVGLAYQGSGAATGTAKAPRIRWELGTLRADVTPERGIDLVVETPEAEVRVVGTVFDVHRDTLGTRVSVERGQVVVRCAEVEGTRVLRAGDTTACLPVRAAGLLARAHTLREQGADAADVLDALDGALARAAEDPVADEVRAVRAAVLADAGRVVEARAEADALLADGAGARTAEVARLAARLALPVSGCDATLAYLARIPPGERLATDEIARADCIAATDPEGARAALHAALALSPSDALAARIHARLAALP